VAAYPFESSAAWKDYLRFYADAVGRADEADRLIAAYEARARALGERIVARRGEAPAVRVVRGDAAGHQVYLRDSLPGIVPDEVGLAVPPGEPRTGFAQDLPPERVGQIDADAIFVWSFGVNPQIAEDNRTAASTLMRSPLWRNLGAVRRGDVFLVGDYWIGGGPLAASAMLDDIERALG